MFCKFRNEKSSGLSLVMIGSLGAIPDFVYNIKRDKYQFDEGVRFKCRIELYIPFEEPG